ncbi:hypothetical protein PYCCODRAFT_359400 [Trametes coccinea BRFM310]|uniref:Uncharacterized protein n=1 Tax=Trametes coccinea (strain BRFM310) TaxID=1353009 RepID=A0A1Y2J5Y7_TRAC3|nr:hypothetical protein PYCCODRAFT_359400 [Trametes coccinea BRFM310]
MGRSTWNQVRLGLGNASCLVTWSSGLRALACTHHLQFRSQNPGTARPLRQHPGDQGHPLYKPSQGLPPSPSPNHSPHRIEHSIDGELPITVASSCIVDVLHLSPS